MVAPPEIAVDEQRLALARVLDSRTFSRSDQLRAFLRYVCEAAFEGRAHELNEYALGVSVLGRRAGYSPAEDSGVRSRAYELRNKLKAYYRDEAPEDPIQIEIEKGAYVPRFHRRENPAPEKPPAAPEKTPAAEPLAPPLPAAPVPAPPARTGVFAARWGIAALALGAVLAIVSGGLFWSGRAKPVVSAGLAPHAATPEMLALWKPFLDTNVPLLISFEVRLFFYAPATGLVVRDAQTNQVSEAAQSKPLTAFQERMGADKLIETHDYADVGVGAGRVPPRPPLEPRSRPQVRERPRLAGHLEQQRHLRRQVQRQPDDRRVLRDANLDFVDSEFGARFGTCTRYPANRPSTNATTHGAGKKYGVITVLPGPQPGRHMMILTGSGAELMWALAQSVADPGRVKEIMSHVMTPSGRSSGRLPGPDRGDLRIQRSDQHAVRHAPRVRPAKVVVSRVSSCHA